MVLSIFIDLNIFIDLSIFMDLDIFLFLDIFKELMGLNINNIDILLNISKIDILNKNYYNIVVINKKLIYLVLRIVRNKEYK